MVKNPAVSMVIPAYNYAEYLDEAIESVLNRIGKISTYWERTRPAA